MSSEPEGSRFYSLRCPQGEAACGWGLAGSCADGHFTWSPLFREPTLHVGVSVRTCHCWTSVNTGVWAHFRPRVHYSAQENAVSRILHPYQKRALTWKEL